MIYDILPIGDQMLKVIFKPFILLAKLINYITVNIVKFTNLITSFILILIMILIGALYYADSRFTDGYYSYYLVQFIFIGDRDFNWFFQFSDLIENNMNLAIMIFIALLLILFVIRHIFKNVLTKDRKKNNAFTNILFLVINIILSFTALTLIYIFVLNLMITRYVNFTTGKNVDIESTGFLMKVDYLRKNIESDKQISSIALNKITYDINNKPNYFYNITIEERIKICEQVNHLIDIQGGPKTSDEHYLRNKLNYAPENFDAMLLEIKNGNDLGWQIMTPGNSAFHMFGENGEYNIKLVSGNGFFEAVYNKNGELIDENNDPANMGTYNYADPNKEANKHSIYDVATYYIWGNTKNSKHSLKPDSLNNLEKFYKNKDAVDRYDKIKETFFR